MVRTLWISALALGLAGCAGPYVEEPPWPAPTPVARVPGPDTAPYQPTSLWVDGGPLTAVYQDHRARRVGDLVTVIVIESSEASREASTDLSRDASVNASVDNFLGVDLTRRGFDPKVAASTANSFKGAGSTRRKDVLRSRVSARVVHILEDGNLVVEGRRQVKVNDETQYLFVRGIARLEDITPDNTVTSVALADAQILYGGSGSVSAQQRPGWMYRFLDAVWPF